MSYDIRTADLAFPLEPLPRLNETFCVDERSYVDLMLPSSGSGGERARLRLYDFTDRWIKAADCSGFRFVPDHDDPDFLAAPHATFDDFELGEPFPVGRKHNPDNLPILNKNVVSRVQLSITVSLGHRGLLLSLHDKTSHNGTELVMNDTLRRVRKIQTIAG